MSSISAKTAETVAYDFVRSHPFTPINGRPTFQQSESLKKEQIEVALEVEVGYPWSQEYGCMAEVLDHTSGEYENVTTIASYVIEVEPVPYDPAINAAMTPAERKQAEAVWSEGLTSWGTLKGCRRGIADNTRDALDEEYYIQLSHRLTKYKRIHPRDYVKHLRKQWCPMDTNVIKELKAAYYAPWAECDHLTSFRKRLEDEQEDLARFNIIITDGEKL